MSNASLLFQVSIGSGNFEYFNEGEKTPARALLKNFAEVLYLYKK